MSTIRKFSIALMLILVETSLPLGPAWAADVDALLAQGVRLRREGKDHEALPLFQEAFRQRSSPQVSAQLGFCEQALGLWLSAENHLSESLKHDQDPWIQKHAPTLRESVTFLQGKLGSIEVWGSPPGARIRIDGETVGNLPVERALRAAEGRHVLLVEAPNFLPETRVLNVRSGTLSREHVSLTAEPTVAAATATATLARPTAATSEPQATPVPPAARRYEAPPASSAAAPTDTPVSQVPTWRRILPWSLLGAAVVAGAAGAWQHSVWNTGVDRFEAIAGCGQGAPMKGTDPRCQGLYNDYAAARLRTFAGYGVAGLMAAGAATFFILNATVPDEAATDGGTVGLAIGRNGTTLAYSLTF